MRRADAFRGNRRPFGRGIGVAHRGRGGLWVPPYHHNYYDPLTVGNYWSQWNIPGNVRGRGESSGSRGVGGARGSRNSQMGVTGQGLGVLGSQAPFSQNHQSHNSPNSRFGTTPRERGNANGRINKRGGRRGGGAGVSRHFPLQAVKKEAESGVLIELDLIQKLTDGGFYNEMNKDKPSMIDRCAMIYLLAKVTEMNTANCRSLVHDILKQAMNGPLLEDTAKFLCREAEMCLVKDPPDLKIELQQDIVNLVKILIDLMEKFPTNKIKYDSSVTLVKSMLGEIEKKMREDVLPEMMELWQSFKTSWDDVLRHVTKKPDSSREKTEETEKPPPDDFRQLDIFPSKNDILKQSHQTYLRANIVQGSYIDSQHYLDVQFRLLREDYIHPLRKGIKDYKEGRKADLRVYTGITIHPPQVDRRSGELTSLVVFDVSKLQRVKWEVSKRLIYGTLVCFSLDHFERNLIFATVFNRDPHKLKHGQIEVHFERPEAVKYSAVYTMVESDAYFESYRHVLEGLKAIRIVPFAKYLVECNPVVEAPRYFRYQNQVDFSPLIKDELRDSVDAKQNVFDKDSWPSQHEMGFDPSQYDAVYQALTKELAIIQGPPGTGKTFIGWKIAQVLLHNKNLWNPLHKHPILVVCFTNHALDQFLEAILAFQKGGIVRVGGRCKSEKLDRFTLYNLRYQTELPSNLNAVIGQAKRAQGDVRNRMNVQAACWNLLRCEIPNISMLTFGRGLWKEVERLNPNRFIPDHQLMSLKSGPGHVFENDDLLLAKWLTKSPNSNPHTVIKPCIINALMHEGFSEPEAKQAACLSGNSSVESALDYAFNYQLFSDPIVNRLVDKWPAMVDVVALVHMGYPEELVVEAFCATKTKNIHAALAWLQRFFDPPQNQAQQLGQWVAPGNGVGPELQPNDGQASDEEDIGDLGIELEDLGIDRRLLEDEFDDESFFRGDGVQSVVGDTAEDFREIINYAKTCNFINWSDILRPMGRSNDGFTLVTKSKKESNPTADRMKQSILGCKPMSEEEASAVADVWRLQLPERWRLFRLWAKKLAQALDAELKRTATEYSERTKTLRETKAMGDIEIMRGADVLGMTTTGAAKHQGILQTIQPRIVIMEEAAEVLEAHLVTSLSSGCQHVILIGDHKQLRPNPSVFKLAQKYHLDISLFERLIKNNFEFSHLKLQHRMRPEISRTLMPHFYDDLEDDPSVFQYESIRGMQRNVFFLNHAQSESSEGDLKSRKNAYEAQWAVAMCNYFLQQDYDPEDITVLVAYSGQLFETRKVMAKKLKFPGARIRVTVLDNYQGEESDIIILSLVRSPNPNQDQTRQSTIGFLKVKNRVCVAMSRAKKGFYCLGNFDHLRTAELDKQKDQNGLMWENIVASLKEKDFIGTELPVQCENHENKQAISHPAEFETKATEGGCGKPCSIRMECGHTCEKMCHSYDVEHRKIQCKKDCGKTKACGIHKCKKKCFEKCGPCRVKVLKTLPCKHEMMVECYMEEGKVACNSPCDHVLPCEHKCQNLCYQVHTKSCQILIDKALPCGHTVKGACHMSPEKIWCQTLVTKTWPGCEHKVDVQCSTEVKNVSCPAPCGQILKPCEHRCKGKCGECRAGRLHVRCQEPCKAVLVCGHECQSKCSKACPPCTRKCETACEHNQCGKGSPTNYLCHACPGKLASLVRAWEEISDARL